MDEYKDLPATAPEPAGSVEKLRPELSVSTIEPARGFRYDARLDLGAGFAQPVASRYAPHSISAPVANILIHDVVLDAETGLLFHAGNVLHELCYPPRPAEEEAARKRAAMAERLPPGRLVWCGFNRHWRNHFHWLTQCVPAIVGYATEPAWPQGSLLLPPLQPDQMAALELAGVDPRNVISTGPSHAIACDRLVYSTLLMHQARPSPFCRRVFSAMAKPRPATDGRSAPSAIYVWRADTENRPLLNETELVEMLLARGIEPVIASALTIAEKAALFGNARLVIGAHGAGLGNIVFCQAGAVVYELMPEHWLDSIAGPGINLLAQQHGLQYWADAHPAHGTFSEFGHRVPWTADLDLVRRRLDEIDAIASAAAN
jgi:capsular polysaccharide biosynthesis protein